MKNSFLKIFFAFVFLLSPLVVLAGTTHNISGWAWSDNIGWISLNSTNCDADGNGHQDVACGGDNATGSVVDYGVNYDSDTGLLTGYAWANPVDTNAVTASTPISPATTTIQVTHYVHGTYDWVVPAGVTSINVKMWGASGGNGGGGGGYTGATVAVTPNETLHMLVGQAGIRGGGSGAACTGTGGGQTYLQKNNTKILIAGGGGGGACLNGYYGGAGGGLIGQDGWNTTVQGHGGTQTAGGAGGSGNGGAGSAGTLGVGGNGGGSVQCGDGSGAVAGSGIAGGGGGNAVSNNSYSCAGGGGGYYGGGGGGTNYNLPYGPGGGGSGFVSTNSAVTNGVTTTGNVSTPGNANDTDRNGAGQGPAIGAEGTGTDGAVVISFTPSVATEGSTSTANVTNNIGWIKFGGLVLDDLPSGNGTVSNNAKMDSNGNLSGWIKALSAGGPTTGWDGFISLSGDGYGASLASVARSFHPATASNNDGLLNKFSSLISNFFNTAYASGTSSTNFAYGSDVVGLVDFSGGIVNAAITSGTLTGDNCVIPDFNTSTCTTTLTFNVVNPVTGAVTNITKPGNIQVATGITPTVIPGVVATYPSTRFSLNHNNSVLATKDIGVTCPVGSGFSDSLHKCVAGLVNGSCNSSHLDNNGCRLGTRTNFVDDDPSAWTWSCQGSNGGSTTSCPAESKPPVPCPDGQHLNAPLPNGICVNDGELCADGINIVGGSPGCVRKIPGYQNN